MHGARRPEPGSDATVPDEVIGTGAPATPAPVTGTHRAGATRRRWWPAAGLFLLAPWVGEYLHGNMSISALPWLALTAPLYGGGALVIREVARRAGRGWPTMILLGLAYGVIEEGLVTHSLFNPSYFGYSLLSPAHVPALGMGAWWTLFVLTLHTLWSTSAAIALAESMVPERATERWLGNTGLAVAAVLFAVGCVLNWWGTYDLEQFVPSPVQLAATTLVVVLLVAAALRVSEPRQAPTGRAAPPPWWPGVLVFAATSVFMVLSYLPGWPAAGVYVTLYAAAGILVWRWACRPGWGPRHRLALAAGALVTYAWYAFPSSPLIGTRGEVDLIGNVVFAAALAAILALAVRGRYAGTEASSFTGAGESVDAQW